MIGEIIGMLLCLAVIVGVGMLASHLFFNPPR